ncbi:unnamed protein product [Lepeophtheirus salmonis]|uniref:(salmon louse) hypothetical protein n=2 Tax=Lepeophtheirus salmonis TaxID=72036 RepID=A0A7R8CRT0_LEPSM|nr:unnamed protein product [Lepeophtheirus salmonis]CAF2910000.1 unnamed protein product [Lepeophtheirus salmonis]
MIPEDCASPFIFNIFRYGLALLYLGSLFIVIGYHNPWIAFIRYIGLSMIILGMACLIVSSIHGIARFIRQNHVIDSNDEDRSTRDRNHQSSNHPSHMDNSYLYSQDEKMGLPNYEAVVDSDLPTYEEAQALRLNPRLLTPDHISPMMNEQGLNYKKRHSRKSSLEDRRPLSLIGSYRRHRVNRDIHEVEAQNESGSNVSSPIMERINRRTALSQQIPENAMEYQLSDIGEIYESYSLSSFESISDDEDNECPNSDPNVRRMGNNVNRRHTISVVSETCSEVLPIITYSTSSQPQPEEDQSLCKNDRAKTANIIYHR